MSKNYGLPAEFEEVAEAQEQELLAEGESVEEAQAEVEEVIELGRSLGLIPDAGSDFGPDEDEDDEDEEDSDEVIEAEADRFASDIIAGDYVDAENVLESRLRKNGDPNAQEDAQGIVQELVAAVVGDDN